MKEKVETSKLKCMEEELKKKRTGPEKHVYKQIPRQVTLSWICDPKHRWSQAFSGSGFQRRFWARVAKESAQNALPVPTKATQSKWRHWKQQFENKLEHATRNCHFPVLFCEKKWPKIVAKRSWIWARKSRTLRVERISTQVPLQRQSKPGKAPKTLLLRNVFCDFAEVGNACYK